MDVSQYLEIFIDETREHLQNLNEQLLVLEKEPENKDTINEIFRAAHSLKGMAGTMGYKRMQKLTHDMENVFSEIRNDKMKVTASLVDILFQCLDALEEYLDKIVETRDEGTNDNDSIIQELNKFLNGQTNTTEATQTKQEELKAEVQSMDVKDKFPPLYKEMTIESHEKHAFSKVIQDGMHIYGITIFIQETCVLKAARAFLVFKSIEDIGEVGKSNPSVQEIEDEKFDFHFSIFVISKEPIEKVIQCINSVSEIAKVVGEELDIDAIAFTDEDKETEAETEVKQTSTTTQPAKQTGKPVINHTVRVDIEKLDVLMNLVSELIIAKNSLVSVSENSNSNVGTGFNEQIEYLERVTTNLHESVMKVRMVPIESVVNRFPRMIRDLSKKLNKKMELYMTGEDTELDRTVIDEIGDPLMHLLRNSADHGLESAEVRAKRGKPEMGSIFLDAYQDGNNVVIEVRDDGNGIDIEAVKKKAIERGVITHERAETMDSKDIIDLLFLPSFSMAKKVSDVSGRGVGLDVVKSKIESLGGDVEVKNKYGEGSNFIIRLPLTLAIIQALMVVVGEEKYAISLGSIQTIEDIPVSDIKYVEAREVIHLRGNVIPLIRLNRILDIQSAEENVENMTVVIAKKGDRYAGFVVDYLIGQQEIVIKSLGKYININKMISGATILGDGEVALILDVNTLI